jgi:hypothetical protein
MCVSSGQLRHGIHTQLHYILNILMSIQHFTILLNSLQKISHKKTRALPGLYIFHLKKSVHYFTLSTIALKAAGWFIARSAKTFLLISMALFFNSPINCEYDRPSKRAAALIR